MSDAKQATPHEQLIAELMRPTVPKTEREHAAVREIERLRAELNDIAAALPGVPDWQPIETAPKDGEKRLLLVVDHGEWGDKVWMGLWADGWVLSYGKAINEPTHWMPLPEAPKPEPTP